MPTDKWKVKPLPQGKDIIVLQEWAGDDLLPKAVVKCPRCSTIFEKRRNSIRKHRHTICYSCAMAEHRKPLPNNDDTIVIREFIPGHTPEALVQCPDCGYTFRKQRSAILSHNHTVCHRCVMRRNGEEIKNIPNVLIVIEQYSGTMEMPNTNSRPLCTICCPVCLEERQALRHHILRLQHSVCHKCNRDGHGFYGPNWNKISLSIRERDDFQCQYPGCSVTDDGIVLHVHHIIPYLDSGDNSPTNLITLCPTHHCWADSNLSASIPLLRSVLLSS